ncbi:MAG: sugar ABC transporter ATP-binding protein [Myxococcales bacterium]|nr:sugar ABC transporter ATP-binding protein [Myxococcales bacterium]
MTAPALTATSIKKSFGPTVALEGASLTAFAGEVHALLGENGAGKSTLLGIIAGLIEPDGGTLELGGAPYAPGSPVDAREAGIAFVPQEPTLALHLDVTENVVLGREPSRFGFVDRRASEAIARAALARLGLSLDPRAPGASLSPAERQLVGIARALAGATPRVVVVDEPTSSLAHAEAERVLSAVSDLARSGVCVLYVSHHLEEILRVAQRYTVLRDGRTVQAASMEGTTLADLTKLLLGHEVAPVSREETARGETVLEVKNLSGARLPRSASLVLHRGEVLGVAGLVGSGRTELLRAIFGLDPVVSGEVLVKTSRAGASRGGSPAARIAQGVGMASEDRKEEGLVLGMPIADNLTLSALGSVSQGGFVSPGKQREVAEALVGRLSIRAASTELPTSTLSGGNQQKVALGRLVHQDADVLLLDEPTRGIDIKSREQIYDIVRALAARGKAVLWVSSQLPELLRVCDRVVVMKKGAVGAPFPVSGLTEHRLLEKISEE